MLPKTTTTIALGLAVWGCRTDLKDTAAPPADVAAYEPFAHVAQVLSFAGRDAKLLEMTATGVASSGKIAMVGAPSARVDHRMAAKDDQGRYVNVRVEVHEPRNVNVSGNMDESTPKRHLGMGRQVAPFNTFIQENLDSHAIPLPTCSATALWKLAATAGAPVDALATITYDSKGYELRVLAPRYFALQFERDCTPRKP